MYNGTDIGRGD